MNVPPSYGAAIRWFASSGKASKSVIRLLCHIKPGVNATREGISTVTDEYIEVCVAGQPRDGEANKAVVKVIAEAVKLPKSSIQIIKGLHSRQKVVEVITMTAASPEEQVERTRNALLAKLGGVGLP
jgi:uncharacterized protein YggU (UPF0235/DUF167 family)